MKTYKVLYQHDHLSIEIKASSVEWGGNGLKFYKNEEVIAHFSQYIYWMVINE